MALIRKKGQALQAGGPNGASAPVLANQPEQRSPTGRVNLDTLLGLNKESAEAMGRTLVDPAVSQAQSAKSSLNAAQSKFAQQKQAGTLTYKGGASQGSATSMAGGYYSGPSSLEQASPGLGQQIRTAADSVARVGSQTGRMSLLQKQQNQSEYGSGASALDSYLAGQGAKPELTDLQQNYGSLEQMLGLSEAQAAREAQTAAMRSREAAAKYAADARNPQAAQRRLRSMSAAEDQRITEEQNAQLRGYYGKNGADPGFRSGDSTLLQGSNGAANPDQRLQQMSDLDWMIKSGKITSAQYNRALDDPQYFQSLMAQYG